MFAEAKATKRKSQFSIDVHKFEVDTTQFDGWKLGIEYHCFMMLASIHNRVFLDNRMIQYFKPTGQSYLFIKIGNFLA